MKKYLLLILLGTLLAGNAFGARQRNSRPCTERPNAPFGGAAFRTGRIERSADVNFVRGDFRRAMTLYRRALAAIEKKYDNERLTLEQRKALLRRP